MLTWVGFAILILILVLVLTLVAKTPTTPEAPVAIMQESPVHGRGMFATKPIRKGEVIECAPLVLFDRSDVKKGSILLDYDIQYSGDKHAIMLGHACLYNHADDSNASWFFNSVPEIVITATRDIEEGGEVFVNYGPGYWTNRKDKI